MGVDTCGIIQVDGICPAIPLGIVDRDEERCGAVGCTENSII